MEFSKKLSVIVPVYNMNHDGNLNFCLDSLVNQTVKDMEIIAVNDASTDDSLDVLYEYEKKFPDLFKVITYSENKKQGGAKNEGLKVASGEWIGFIDSDDWVSRDYYEKLIKKGEETGADIVGCDYNIVSSHTYVRGNHVSSNNFNQVGELTKERMSNLFRSFGSMVIKIYKHEIIKENNLGFPEGIFYEDNCAARVWAPYFKHFEYINEDNYYYLQHDTSTVHTITEQRCLDRISAMNTMVDELTKRGLYDEYKDEIENVYTQLGFRITLFSYMLGCKEKKFSFVYYMKRDFKKKFPDFMKNKYYSIPNKEEEKMMNLCMKSSLIFYIYYSFLWIYRNHKAGK